MEFDVGYGAAGFAGLLSFLSPCILPIVPFYLSYLAGVAIEQISEGSEISSDTRRKATFSALAFAAGIITIFVALGATASVFGQLVRDYFDVLRWIAAAIIIAMGSPGTARNRTKTMTATPASVTSANSSRVTIMRQVMRTQQRQICADDGNCRWPLTCQVRLSRWLSGSFLLPPRGGKAGMGVVRRSRNTCAALA